jgi:hypothetical protein
MATSGASDRPVKERLRSARCADVARSVTWRLGVKAVVQARQEALPRLKDNAVSVNQAAALGSALHQFADVGGD